MIVWNKVGEIEPIENESLIVFIKGEYVFATTERRTKYFYWILANEDFDFPWQIREGQEAKYGLTHWSYLTPPEKQSAEVESE